MHRRRLFLNIRKQEAKCSGKVQVKMCLRGKRCDRSFSFPWHRSLGRVAFSKSRKEVWTSLYFSLSSRQSSLSKNRLPNPLLCDSGQLFTNCFWSPAEHFHLTAFLLFKLPPGAFCYKPLIRKNCSPHDQVLLMLRFASFSSMLHLAFFSVNDSF